MAQAESFTGRVVRTIALVGLAIACWRLVDALLLLFSAILLAVALRGLAAALHRASGLAVNLCLGVVVLALVGLVGGTAWLFGSQIALQYDQIVARAPIAISAMSDAARAHPLGRYLVAGLEGPNASASGAIAAALTSVITATLGGLAYAVLVFFGGLYLAAEPERYRSGLLRLVPPDRRAGVSRFLDDCGTILRRWLLGQLVIMVTIGVLSGIGLRLLGIDAAVALGLTGGLLCFVPYVGAILAAVPAVLMAFTQSPFAAFTVALLFAGVHFVEGNFVTPMVEDRAVSLPPVISVFATLVFTLLFGPFAVMIAAPATIAAIRAIETFYLGDGEAG
ncbi:MAG: AI-2E family transporter [Sphingomonadales bacterium]|nr:AI-2E family transporter [Sphingomonadales bacterium]